MKEERGKKKDKKKERQDEGKTKSERRKGRKEGIMGAPFQHITPLAEHEAL